MAEYDIVVVGGGHNGLTAAAYFATCGFPTIVVEKNSVAGGGVVTREVMPNVKMDLHSYLHAFIQANPMIKEDELGLISEFGLEYIRKEQLESCGWLDGSQLIWYKDVARTMQSIEKISKKDASNYGNFMEWVRPKIEQVLPAMFEPPIPMSTAIGELESSPEGREMLQLTYMNVIDLSREWFEDPHIQSAAIRLGTDWSAWDPRAPGNAMVLVLLFGSLHYSGWGMPKGGSGQLSEALVRCIRARGGDVMLNSLVTEIVLKNGRAIGVKTADGKMIAARRAVVADLNIKQLPALCGEANLESSFLRAVRRLTHSYSAGSLEMVVKDYPRFPCNSGLFASHDCFLIDSLEEMFEVYDGISRGNPCSTLPHLMSPSLLDPTRAPAGMHTLNIWQPQPYELRDGGAPAWDAIKDKIAQMTYETVQKYCPNMTDDKIVMQYFHSPLDFERWNPSFMHGDESHIAPTLGQGSYRPLPGFENFGTPIEGLFLCGPSTHVGGGVTGQSRAAAKAIVNQLGQDFGRLMASARNTGERKANNFSV